MREFVFGYGSLAAELPFAPARGYRDEGFIATLRGFARGWGVAMDNRCDLPGYKYYTAPDGSRPEVFVAFVDVREQPGGVVNGLCLPVDAERLRYLDHRERNYHRRDVSDRVDAGGARVWTYQGRPDSRERLRAAHAAGRAVIDAGYRDAVRAAFAALGDAELAAAEASLAPDGLPITELCRHALP